jgi:predicted DCC family thiol-disulfide oxidoreductase YuxK
MRELTVLYDATCALCQSARTWLEQEPRHVSLKFVAAGSDEAVRRFPALDPADTLRDIAVVDDEGGVYRGAKAWVMCLWATRRYRSWSVTLVDPDMWPLAKRLIAWVSRNRSELGSIGGFVLRRI